MNVYFATQSEIHSMTTTNDKKETKKQKSGRRKMFVNHRLSTMK